MRESPNEPLPLTSHSHFVTKSPASGSLERLPSRMSVWPSPSVYGPPVSATGGAFVTTWTKAKICAAV